MNQNNDKQFTQTTFEQFLNSHNSSRKTDEVEFQKLFLSLDKKMHLYHSNGYAISSFRIQDIVVYQMINNDGEILYDVDFKKWIPEGNNKEELETQNVFYAACLAVGTYNNCLSYIDPDHPEFLKNNFSLFAENMPTEVVPYYRGVIERGSFVYLDSYETERKNRNIRTMQEEERKMKEQEEEMHKNMNPPKSSRKNDKWGTSESAFISLSLFPFVMAILSIVIPIIIGIFA
jgi:hypothetical protein